MNCSNILQSAIIPALALLPPRMDSPEARVMLLAIGLQESKFTARCQVLDGGARGPAHGYWQFERGGGVRGVVKHPRTVWLAANLCGARHCPLDIPEIWGRIETDDVLAAGFARLLLWTDLWQLPNVGDVKAAWSLYERCWQPGKPHPESWPGNHAMACAEVAS